MEGSGSSSSSKPNENSPYLVPVDPNSSGVGHPYAPENWPNPGDIWGWKVGNRISAEGHFLDRYLVLPTTFQGTKNSVDEDLLLRSKAQVEMYIKTNFPDADIDAFFASFHWKIPSNVLPLIDIPIKLQTSEILPSNVSRTKMNILYISSDVKVDTDNIAAEVDQVLQDLREAHEEQFELAREALTSQKNYVNSLYEKYGREKEEMANQTSGTFNFIPKSFTDVMDEIKNEVERLRNMEDTAKKVAKNSMDNLMECFEEILSD